MRNYHLRRRGGVAVDRVAIAAEHIQEPVDLALRVVETPGARPTVGAAENRRVALGVLDPAQFAGDEIEGFIPAQGDERLGAAAAEMALWPAFAPSLADHRLADPDAVMHGIEEGLTDG
jgi:hypothetical protein